MDIQKARHFFNSLIKTADGSKIYEDSPWDGSASRWETAEDYCADCLIDLNPPGEEKVKGRCYLPYRHPGSSQINIRALRAMASGARGLPAVKGVPMDQIVKAANWIIRHWNGAFGKPAPASIYRLAGKRSPERDKSTFLKSADGTLWFLGIYSNKFKDVEGDILSERAHREFAEWANRNNFHPQLTLLHLPRMPNWFWQEAYKALGQQPAKMNELLREVYKDYSIGEVERVIPLDGFIAVVARIKPEAAPIAEKLSALPNLGMSHGFIVLDFHVYDKGSGASDGIVVDRYRTYEVSILPQARAANKFTLPIFVRSSDMAMSEQDKRWLCDIGIPPDLVNAAEADVGLANQILERILAYKGLAEGDAAELTGGGNDESGSKQEQEGASGERETDNYEQYRERIIEDLKIADLHRALAELATAIQELSGLRERVDGLSSAVNGIEKAVSALKKSDDEKIGEKFAPIKWPIIGFSPASDPSTTVSERVARAICNNAPGAATSTGNEEVDLFLSSLMGNLRGK